MLIPDEPRIPAYMGIINNPEGVNHIQDNIYRHDGNITIEMKSNSSMERGTYWSIFRCSG